MTECLVCSMPNTGFHFGVNSCRACAAFFRRTNQLKLEYKCRFGQKCDVTKKNRYSCRYCRFQKCLKIGMAREVNSSSSSPTAIEQNRASVVKYSDRQPDSTETTSDDYANDTRISEFPYTIPLSLCQQALIAYAEHSRQWPNCTMERLRHVDVIDMEQMSKNNYVEVENIAKFCMSIDPFVQLPHSQKWIIFKHFWPRFVEMDRAFITCKLLGNDPTDERTVTHTGLVVNLSAGVTIQKLETVSNFREEELRSLMKSTFEVFKKLFTIPFKKYKPDEFELMYMCMSMMWNIKDLDGVTPETMEIAENVRSRLSEDLYNYYAFELKLHNYAHRIYKLSHLVTAVDRISERKQEDSYMSRTFNIFKHDIFLDSLRHS